MGTEAFSEDIVLIWEPNENDFRYTSDLKGADNDIEECIICSRQSACYPSSRQAHRVFIEHVPNAVGYIYTGAIEPEGNATCPAGDRLCSSLHPLRDVAVMTNGMIETYHADGGYASHVMMDVKFSREQLYLNISGNSMNLDFRTAFRRLSLYDICRECVRRRTRSGIFELLDGNAFLSIEEQEMKWLKEIKGRILDVGCGKPLFPDILSRKIAWGEIEYLGVDNVQEYVGEIKVEVSKFEDFCWDGTPFDHVMMLRSYNHFMDPRIVLEKAAALLKPGGFLHIFENGLFALLNKNVSNDASDFIQPRYQHYRNHYSEDLLKLLPFICNFEVVSHSMITPGNANQWFLTLRKNQY
jgi:SAM-dependent methyltransferase